MGRYWSHDLLICTDQRFHLRDLLARHRRPPALAVRRTAIVVTFLEHQTIGHKVAKGHITIEVAR